MCRGLFAFNFLFHDDDDYFPFILVEASDSPKIVGSVGILEILVFLLYLSFAVKQRIAFL